MDTEEQNNITSINLKISPENIGKKYIEKLSDSIENNNLYFGISVSIVMVATLSLLLLVQISSIVIATQKTIYTFSIDGTMRMAVVAFFIGIVGCIISANTANTNYKKRNEIFGTEGEN